MAIPFFLSLAIWLVIFPYSSAQEVVHRRNLTQSSTAVRRKLLGCSRNINPIDVCSGRCIHDWIHDRQRIAGCGVGYGKYALGVKGDPFYVVMSSADNDAVNPTPGTLRHAVLQNGPLWIVFKLSMTIRLKEELIMTPYKTIDGRGANVVLTGCSGITIQYVNNIIINGITIAGMRPCGNANVRSSLAHYGHRGVADGDGISISGSTNIWINHCTLSDCADGLVDVVLASTGITVSNSRFNDHDKVMLLGHNDAYTPDKNMHVTVAFNYFGRNLGQRMPRCRFGYVELINNYYPSGWGNYAVGGSACPTITSKGNFFVAPDNIYHKQVKNHANEPESKCEGCSWSSENVAMLNGAFFTTSGFTGARTMSMGAGSPGDVIALTAHAGAPA